MNTRIPNIDAETGIHYGVVSMASLDDSIWDRIYGEARNLTFEAYAAEGVKEADAKGLEGDARDCFIEEWRDAYDADEEEYLIESGGVVAATGWLGGAPLMFVSKSPYLTKGVLCSPCVPNAVNLDEGPGSVLAYDVPPEWYAEDAPKKIRHRIGERQ